MYDTASLRDYFVRIADQAIIGPGMPLLVDRFLDDAIEIDVDALYDGRDMVHVEAQVRYEDGRTGTISADLKIRDCRTYPPAAARKAA